MSRYTFDLNDELSDDLNDEVSLLLVSVLLVSSLANRYDVKTRIHSQINTDILKTASLVVLGIHCERIKFSLI